MYCLFELRIRTYIYVSFVSREEKERKNERGASRNEMYEITFSRMILVHHRFDHRYRTTRLKFLFSKFDYACVDRFLTRRDITGEQAVCASATRQPRCSPIFPLPPRRSETGRCETRAVATRNKLYAFKTCIVA